MKVEFGIQILSKRETLAGIHIHQRKGVSIDAGELCEEHLTEFRFGFVFVIITIGFAKLGNQIETPDRMIKAMKAFQSELNDNNDNNNNNE